MILAMPSPMASHTSPASAISTDAPASTFASASTRGPMLPPIGALPSLSISPVHSSRRAHQSPSRVRSHSHNFVHSHSPSHSIPPLGGARPRTCRLLGCANFAKIQGYCAAHFHKDDSFVPSAATSPPTTRLPSLRTDHPRALERPRLPQPSAPVYYAAPPAAGHSHSHHNSPLYAPDHHHSYPQHYQQLPSLSLRRFSEPTALAMQPIGGAFPRVSPLHRHDAFAYAQFRRAQPTSEDSFQRSPTHSVGSADDASPSTAAPTLTPKARCRRENCTNAARRKGLCMEHGGRHFCKMEGCQKCAHRGGYCIAHGGGRRCAVADCTKSAQSGGVCYSHGGGKRCATDGCSHAARSGGFCIKHGKMVKAQTTTADDDEANAKESGDDSE